MEDSNGKPKYDGVRVWMNGKEWIVPALSLSQFRRHHCTLTNTDLKPQDWQEPISSRIPIILEAIQRNYPEMTEQQLLDMIDLRTYRTIFDAIIHASGLRAALPGEEQPVASTSTGVGSTER